MKPDQLEIERLRREFAKLKAERVNGGVKSGHAAAQKSATLARV